MAQLIAQCIYHLPILMDKEPILYFSIIYEIGYLFPPHSSVKNITEKQHFRKHNL